MHRLGMDPPISKSWEVGTVLVWLFMSHPPGRQATLVIDRGLGGLAKSQGTFSTYNLIWLSSYLWLRGHKYLGEWKRE